MQNWVDEMELRPAGRTYDLNEEEFTLYLNFIKTGIIQGDFEKVVASRTATLDLTTPDPIKIFSKACDAYPAAFVYMLYHPGWGCWLGASPEKFTIARNTTVEISAVAGTLFQKKSNWTPKEELEQSVIEKYYDELLAARGITPSSHSARTELSQGNIKHLVSNYVFDMDPGDFNQFLRDMHPTPAVCGYPKKEAMMFIERFEDLERELFTGWLGWGQKNEFKSYVNLRCCRLYSDKVRFFAGCGINAQSNPKTEWLETEAKLDIMRRFF